MKLDVMAIGAHPDDIELVVGGTLLKLADQGYKTGVIDMVRGELGTRGSPELRAQEAKASAQILRLSVRANLKLKDGEIFDNQETRLQVIRVLRKYRPDLVFTHFWDDKHPDHVHTSQVVTEACYLSGLPKISTNQERFRPRRIFYFMLPHYVQPSFIVDVSDYFDQKMRAIGCFKSQLYDPNSLEPETYLSVPQFLPALESLHQYYGYLIETKHAEAFYCKQAIALHDPVAFFAGTQR